MKHTPGSWEAIAHAETIHQPNYHSIEAGMVGRSGVVADTLNRDCVIDPEEDAANARLLKAAPTLLAACKALLDGAVTYKFEHWAASLEYACEIARAAIALAEPPTTKGN